ncbi:MAG TPA: M56 family metallopeptidase [Gryllotalpicola sp.]
MTKVLILGLIAVLLAWPVPIVLARARWTVRMPAVAMLCWQAIAVAGGLSMIGALWFVSTGAAALLALHLLLNLGLTTVGTWRQRRRHRQLLHLLSTPMPDRPGTRLIENEAPVAYCLPGAPRSLTVLSDGLLRLLSEEELAAVVAHERAHVTQHHHIVLMAFKAWRTALPWFPIASRAEEAVALLVELLADDDARQVVPDSVLASAVTRVAGADGGSVASRVARLNGV